MFHLHEVAEFVKEVGDSITSLTISVTNVLGPRLAVGLVILLLSSLFVFTGFLICKLEALCYKALRMIVSQLRAIAAGRVENPRMATPKVSRTSYRGKAARPHGLRNRTGRRASRLAPKPFVHRPKVKRSGKLAKTEI
jgi:hypothetical protein